MDQLNFANIKYRFLLEMTKKIHEKAHFLIADKYCYLERRNTAEQCQISLK